MMKNTIVERWLVKQTLSEAVLNLPVGAVCLVASLIYLSITLALVYLVGLLLLAALATFNKSIFENSTLFCLSFCAAFLLWLFYSHYRRNVEYLRFSKFRAAKVHVSDAGFARALNILLSGPRDDDGPFRQLLYTGPQWFISGVSMFYKSTTLVRMDIECCAKILIIVLNKGSRVSFTDLAKLVPECNSIKVFPQLRDIAGVIFLQNEPTGISLTSDLRMELSRVLGVKPKIESQRRTHERPKPPPVTIVEEDPTAPHKILGVSRSASLAEIKAAYRRQIKQCHPDRFATLNKDWQQMAEQRAKAVNEAYAILTENYRARA